MSKIIDVKNEDVKEVEAEEVKQVNPFTDNGNYLLQVIAEDGKTIIKETIINNSTIRVSYLGNQSLAADIK